MLVDYLLKNVYILQGMWHVASDQGMVKKKNSACMSQTCFQYRKRVQAAS